MGSPVKQMARVQTNLLTAQHFDSSSEESWAHSLESTGLTGSPPSALESHLDILEQELRTLCDQGTNRKAMAELELQIARTLVGLDRGTTAWDIGRGALEYFLLAEDWESAADVCEVLFLAGQPQSLAALGQGIWLAVTYPIDPDVSFALLSHVVEETPDDSDGAAVAAATAFFLADLRAEGAQRDNILFFAGQLLGSVAHRHGGAKTQSEFDAWMERMGLRQPEHLLARLRLLVEALVQGNWWFDPEALQAQLPLN